MLRAIRSPEPSDHVEQPRSVGATAALLRNKTDYKICQLRGWVRGSIGDRGSGLWIRKDVRIRGNVRLGDRARLSEHVLLDGREGEIAIGSGTFLGPRCTIYSQESVAIGPGSLIAWEVLIMDTDHHLIEGGQKTRPVRIGSNVWIGARASVLKGVTIGDGAVIAAGAVVTSDVEPGFLAAGVPARAVRPVRWRP